MSDLMEFGSRDEFRKWLCDNCLSSAGIWVLFGKAGGPKTMKAEKRWKKRSALDGLTARWKRLTRKLIKVFFDAQGE